MRALAWPALRLAMRRKRCDLRGRSAVALERSSSGGSSKPPTILCGRAPSRRPPGEVAADLEVALPAEVGRRGRARSGRRGPAASGAPSGSASIARPPAARSPRTGTRTENGKPSGADERQHRRRVVRLPSSSSALVPRRRAALRGRVVRTRAPRRGRSAPPPCGQSNSSGSRGDVAAAPDVDALRPDVHVDARVVPAEEAPQRSSGGLISFGAGQLLARLALVAARGSRVEVAVVDVGRALHEHRRRRAQPAAGGVGEQQRDLAGCARASLAFFG